MTLKSIKNNHILCENVEILSSFMQSCNGHHQAMLRNL